MIYKMNKEQTEKKPYEAPQLTVVSFKVERGYAASGGKFLSLEHLFTSDDETIEQRNASGGYFGGGDGDNWF